MKNLKQLRECVKAEKASSAWENGVKAYALDLIDDLGEFGQAIEPTRKALEKAMLNGARNWQEYSESAMALAYDEDIAKRLCAPWELRKTCDGKRQPNMRETWMNVQARALYQASQMIQRIAFSD